MNKDASTYDVSKASLDVTGKNEREEERRALTKIKITNTEIIENLGQVELCICDKTGTLTENSLTMRCFYTDGKTFNVE